MTEKEWESATLHQIVNWSERPLSVRLGRRLAAGLCRAARNLLPDAVRQAIPVLDAAEELERLELTPELRNNLRSLTGPDRGGLLTPERELGFAVLGALSTDDGIAVCREAAHLALVLTLETFSLNVDVVHGIARDVFGNPFQPMTFSSEWRTDTALALARQMYESREFSAMPILADALQDAGCDNEHILAHCRGAESHVRGCWVCDLVLGK